MSVNTSSDSPSKSKAATSSWTTRDLLAWMRPWLEDRGVDSPRVVGEMLLAHVLGCERMRLYMEVDRPASPEELARLRSLVTRAGEHEPVQYLTGEASFYWRSFEVGPVTLIPQPCTETLVDHVIDWFRDRGETVLAAREEESILTEAEQGQEPTEDQPLQDEQGPLIADIGAGTGCIAISLARQIPSAQVVATDIVDEALQLAQRNAQRYDVSQRIQFLAGDALQPLEVVVSETGRRFDAICSNPPYIPANELELMDAAVRDHVPRSAWFGGEDGLDVIRPLLNDAPQLLVDGGVLAIEIASSQRDAVLDMARAHRALTDVDILKDQDDLWRVLVARTAR